MTTKNKDSFVREKRNQKINENENINENNKRIIRAPKRLIET